MSFFGLTRLGHERPFFSNTDGAYALNIFDDEEFGAAFDAGAGGSPTAASAALRDILERLYRGVVISRSIKLISLTVQKNIFFVSYLFFVVILYSISMVLNGTKH